MTEEDETAGSHGSASGTVGTVGTKRHEDNSLGRLLTLSDGIFAIAMTLLALDLKVPDLGDHPGDRALRHALWANADSYWSYLLTFYVIAGYWRRHRQLMRSVVTLHPALIRDTLYLLLIVAAMPFPASLLGKYGGEPIALALYGAFNAAATVVTLLMSWDVRRLKLTDHELAEDEVYVHRWQSWLSLAVFLLCIPAGYVLGGRAPFIFLLLAIPDRLAWWRRIVGRVRGLRSA